MSKKDMKVCLLSDIHFGVRKGNSDFLDSQMRFFKDQMIPSLKKQKIKHVYFLGDVMDNRNHINVRILSEVTRLFAVDFKDFTVKILVGKHDIYYKTTVKVHSLEFLDVLPNVEVITDIKVDEEIEELTGKRILIVPWITDEEAFVKEVATKNIECDYCFGHFEMTGFNLTKYMPSLHGLDPSIIFDNYDITFSGHYHQRSKKESNGKVIQYLGSPYQITRNDIDDDDRGFAILNINTGDYIFENNTESIKFKKIIYPYNFKKNEIEGNIVDVHIDYDENYKESAVQKYLKMIEKFNPLFPPTVKIENKLNIGTVEELEHQNVEDLLAEYVGILEMPHKDEVLSRLNIMLKETLKSK